MHHRNDVAPDRETFDCLCLYPRLWDIAVVKDDVVSFECPLQLEIRGELPFACLIPLLTSPYLGLNDVFSLIVEDADVYSTAPRLHLKKHVTAHRLDKLIQIGEEEMSSDRLPWGLRDLQNSEPYTRDEVRKIIE